MTRHPCFLALTRPVMRFGVSTTFLGCYFLIGSMFGILTRQYLMALILLALCHGIGMVASAVDPRFLVLMLGKIHCTRLDNRLFWGCTSYEAY